MKQVDFTKKEFNGRIYDAVWADRFNFFEQVDTANPKEAKAALKSLSAIKRMRINMNFYAFLFGPIYFLVKGMWKGAITTLMIAILIVIIGNFLPDAIGRAVGMASAMLCGLSANYTFYRSKVLDQQDYNIFKGMRW